MQNLENLDVFEILITQKLLKCPKDPFVRSALKYFCPLLNAISTIIQCAYETFGTYHLGSVQPVQMCCLDTAFAACTNKEGLDRPLAQINNCSCTLKKNFMLCNEYNYIV